MRQRLARFFFGRYGIDSLGYTLIIVSLVMSLVSSLTAAIWGTFSTVIWILSYVLLVWEIFRMLSRNIMARRRENDVFFGWFKPIKKFVKLSSNKLRDRKTHKYFVCPKCKNNLRVPKGRGEITITCPVCKTRFDGRT